MKTIDLTEGQPAQWEIQTITGLRFLVSGDLQTGLDSMADWALENAPGLLTDLSDELEGVKATQPHASDDEAWDIATQDHIKVGNYEYWVPSTDVHARQVG